MIGAVMKSMGGKADAARVRELELGEASLSNHISPCSCSVRTLDSRLCRIDGC